MEVVQQKPKEKGFYESMIDDAPAKQAEEAPGTLKSIPGAGQWTPAVSNTVTITVLR